MSACTRWILMAALMVATPIVRAEDAATLIARMQAAGIENSLDAPGIKPWHLKVSFQLFDDQHKPSEQGTMEEWWAEPDLYKITFTSPSYSATKIKNKDGLFESKGGEDRHYMLGVLHQMVVHPMPSDKALDQISAKLEHRTIGSVKLDCIHVKEDGKEPHHLLPQVEDPTYCFDRDGNKLRLYTLIGYLEVARNRMGTFQGRTIALDMFITDVGASIMTAHVTALTGYEPDANVFDTTSLVRQSPDLSKPTIHVAPAVFAGRKTGGAVPHYPEIARERRSQGSVVMTATIGTDGHIHDLEVVASPDKDLSKAAQEAVQTWTYQPYLLNGAPVEVETTVTVNFRIGS